NVGWCPPANDSCECVGIATSLLAEIHARQCHGRDRPLVAGGAKLVHQAAEENEAATARPIHSRQSHSSHAGAGRLTELKTTISTKRSSRAKQTQGERIKNSAISINES